ncbi:DNA primase large subunit Spp2 [Kalmusia sp. IMI 367209]|nr:DNA primase large subunit Spp2 [Kalmusia sp. IMI 367209]
MATGGFKLSLVGAKGKPGLKAALEKPAKRRRLALDDDEPEDDNSKQEITGWDAAEGGAVDANAKKEEPKGPRIIPAIPNRDWREKVRQRQLARAGANPTENGNNVEQMGEPEMAYGLTVFDKKAEKEEEVEQKPEPMDTDDGFIKLDDDNELTEDQKLQAEAFEALINGKPTKGAVIPISEEEAFQNDIRDAPDAPTLEAYEATPIEGFGAALLRGMGWKDGESLGTDKKPLETPKEIKRRPALLGIGAKPESAVGIELGEWGQKKNPYQKKTAMKYNPVTLRNKHTGEMISEEELKERLEAQRLADEKAARNSKYVDDGEDDERRREKRREKKDRDRRDDDYDSERKRDKDRRRDRDDDRDRRRDRKYRDEDYDDSDRRREKRHRDEDYEDSDRKREKRRDRDRRDRDRSRSPYDDDRRERRRERDRRDRSVDNEDYRKEKRRERERRDRHRSRSKDSDDRRRRRRDHEYEDDRDDRKRSSKEDKYYRK